MTQVYRRLAIGDAVAAAEPTLTLDELSALVRSLYCAAYRNMSPASADYGSTRIPRWDGGTDDADGRTYQPVWPKVARFILDHGLDPAAYIHVQFMHRRGLRPPAPTTLYSAAALARYEAQRELEVPNILVDWDRQKRSLDMRVAELRRNYPQAEDWRRITTALHDQQQVTASSLFRYCAAVRCGLQAVAAYYFKAALAQYVVQARQYDAAIGDAIPSELRQEAAATMRSFTGKVDHGT